MDVKEEMKRMNKLFIEFCDKQYKVGYVPYGSLDKDYVKFVTGEMINYNSGNIILANEDVVWHIPYGSVKWVFPIKENSKPNERKHGKWNLLDECSNDGVYCSVCSKKVYKADYSNTQKVKSKYCPNCGAIMDLE